MLCKLQWLSTASNGQQFNDTVVPVACCESTLPLLKKEHWKADAAATRAINKHSTRTTAMIASCTAQHLSCGGFFTSARNDFLIREMMLLWLILEVLLLVCGSAAFSSVHTTFKPKSSLVTGLPTAKPVLELVTPDGAAQGDTDVLINRVINTLLACKHLSASSSQYSVCSNFFHKTDRGCNQRGCSTCTVQRLCI
jgi:hypothetical protein